MNDNVKMGQDDFGAVVAVTDTTRHSPQSFPFAMVRYVQSVAGGGHRLSSALFLNRLENPDKFAFANLYDGEYGPIVHRYSIEDACRLLNQTDTLPIMGS